MRRQKQTWLISGEFLITLTSHDPRFGGFMDYENHKTMLQKKESVALCNKISDSVAGGE